MQHWVEQQRGGFAEARHRVHAVACDTAGRVLVRTGVDLHTTFRSAAKPFQLEASLAALDPELVAQLPDDLVALGAASHYGEPQHAANVLRLLALLGESEADLRCGIHPPSHAESYAALLRSGASPSAIHHNCSGKHAFMAAASRALGAAPDYRPADHALQRAVQARVEAATGELAPPRVVDGCGVPSFVLPLSAMARSYAVLSEHCATGGSTLSRIARAMAAHPYLISGTGAFDLWLMGHGVTVAKVGALGLLCAALPGGLGLALKCESGSDLVRAVACADFLRNAFPTLLTEALPERFYAVDNAAGQRVGSIVTRFEPD